MLLKIEQIHPSVGSAMIVCGSVFLNIMISTYSVDLFSKYITFKLVT